MAVSKIPKPYNLKYKDVTIGTISIPSNSYYVEITNYKPSGMSNFLFAEMHNLSSTTSRGLAYVQGDGRYLFGDGGSTFKSVNIRYFYTD